MDKIMTRNRSAQKLVLRVLELVEQAPAHCYDVADELGIDMKTASATLSDLHADGMLIRRHKVTPAGRNRECWLYERPSHKSCGNFPDQPRTSRATSAELLKD